MRGLYTQTHINYVEKSIMPATILNHNANRCIILNDGQ